MNKTKVAILGAGFITDIHMESYHRFIPEADVVACYARKPEKAKAFAEKYHIAQWFDDIDKLLAESGCEVVDICLPNYLHAEATIKAAKAGKHVIIEKPLAVTLEEADEMIAVCKANNVKMMYAEELCFAPKYERARHLVKEGAVGEIYMLKQGEKHSGPHSDWFYDINFSGGGVIMDMGCHALGWFRWMLGNAKPKSVYASMSTVLHKGRTKGEDNSVIIVEFENGVTAVAENSWAKHGGMDDRCEIHGLGGVIYADLFMGNAAVTYSRDGYGYAMEKSDTTKGWSFTIFEEAFNQGYPHELKHFIDCVQNNKTPLVTGEDGRAVLELIYAAYASAGAGKKIELPFSAKIDKPVNLWLGNK
ncbi:Gfo/Idh/MocA family oxidoreductase [Mucilaginibacter rubeus]|uniref:Gfo/Idh/MocA family oxidoreductase n=1 Tax=Mucilaginibacter rubeus TaxID=2027860 RepID=A0AAE6MK99_9SPHI|nr:MULTISPECIES: Gfo/Idh/MocA family oxidoreductase [Mucilaginibacter]QEM06543.1 Gfo/Idh/MocA family oxidoreductase [Mucilaginibacter rubeus]QEM19132.1 Gfo/Idh/MocA family oxidoreductase [Mucilaginibacter gossypii]QTE44327.1 Gfo/Idh/MocA family oxidoreductase [Mucilaginibacter rubeus]QTE50927.1 Gfo/Idh/MocA family oxidoreductase [Mucilaginibacter rubeus]QTE56010.1 Gfo/Idh/MocA family oxidoreductase [Mucilaginibacter rubeus]